jgi:hypothetical protein
MFHLIKQSTVIALCLVVLSGYTNGIRSAQVDSTTSGIGYFAPLSDPFAPPPITVPMRNLQVHGPFEVTHTDLAMASTNVMAPSEPDASIAPNSNLPQSLGSSLRNSIDGTPSESSGRQTPRARAHFDDIAGLNGIDPGIAAGTSYLLVCDNDHGIAVYDKVGRLLKQGPGQSSFPNPFSIGSLFSKVRADIGLHMNLPKGLPPGFPQNTTGYGDVRVMFDSYRNRFWIYARARNDPANDPQTIVDYPAVKLARRQKAVAAVSKTEDPRDGFYTYWWNETIHNGDCNDPKGCSDPDFKTSGEGADYTSIGISPRYFLATAGVNRRDPAFRTDTLERAQKWSACNTTFLVHGQTFNWCGPFYIHMMVVDADMLAKGLPQYPPPKLGVSGPRSGPGRSFGLFVDANNYVTDRDDDGDFAHDMSRSVRPVVMHGPQVKTGFRSPINSADAYFVGTFTDRSGKDPSHRLVLWSLVGDDLVPTQYLIRPFNYHTWTIVLNASYREGKFYATFQERVVWKAIGGNSLYSVRVLRVNTLTSETEIDRTLGVNNKFDDKSSDRYEYKWPGIEVNKNGDIVVVYVRFSSEGSKRSQQVRFSVWVHDEPDIRPSRLLRAGDAMFATNTDTAGIAVDPSDDEAVWVAHIFAGDPSGSNRIAVGKVLGRH